MSFFIAFGMKINVLKSKAMCSKRVHGSVKQSIKEISSIRFVANLGHYLGFRLIQGRATKDIYDYILEKIHRRLSTWKSNLLNKVGRVCLAKSVTTAMPIYILCRCIIYLQIFVIRLKESRRALFGVAQGVIESGIELSGLLLLPPRNLEASLLRKLDYPIFPFLGS